MNSPIALPSGCELWLANKADVEIALRHFREGRKSWLGASN